MIACSSASTDGVGSRIQHLAAQERDHLLVGHRLERARALERREAARREAARLDGREVPPAALDEEHLDAIAEQVDGRALDARVPAAVQDERRIGAEEAEV